ncbi:hypothetical protein PoB_002339000 [Plakobranchus ocellatus]|uniref:Uncharacterized protein n=1 Tax=Plakobranchus ocellatus TaxID=259542 RepID=A0AAV3ZP01_9GAST|nr:hypothetical protein PoB_002339000 [Plakobranchus ocellatus]
MRNLLLVSLLLCLVIADAAPFLKIFKDGNEDFQDAVQRKADNMGKTVPLSTIVDRVRLALGTRAKISDAETMTISRTIQGALKQAGNSLAQTFSNIDRKLEKTDVARLSEEEILEILSDVWWER